MKLTTLFRLRKPDGTDPVNIEDFNDNFDVIDEELGKRLESTGNASDMTAAFAQASTRTNLKTGEKISASFGKIMKWFADLKAVAFSGSYNDLSNKPSIPSGAAASQAVANNCTTTAAGSVLDARQGKVLMDKTNQLSSDLSGVKQSFQDGCNTLVSKCTSLGVTPNSNSPTDISNAMQTIANNQWSAGNTNGWNTGHSQGYNEGYNAGYSAGQSAGTAGYSFTSRIAGGIQRSTVYFPLQRVSSVTVYGSTINQYPCIEIKIAGELVYSRYSAYDSHSIPNITRSVSGGNVQVDVWGINNQHTAIDLYIATA